MAVAACRGRMMRRQAALKALYVSCSPRRFSRSASAALLAASRPSSTARLHAAVCAQQPGLGLLHRKCKTGGENSCLKNHL
jgi:hypothetical protein